MARVILSFDIHPEKKFMIKYFNVYNAYQFAILYTSKQIINKLFGLQKANSLVVYL